MSFPKNSAFHDGQRARESREADRRRTSPEPMRKMASIPVRDLEDIAEGLRQLTLVNDIEDPSLQLDIEDLAERLSSFLPG